MAEAQSDRAASLSKSMQELAEDPRVSVRREGAPKPDGACVVYWMQRTQRGLNNAAVDCAVNLANELDLPLLVYFSAISKLSQCKSATLRLPKSRPARHRSRSGRAQHFFHRAAPAE